MCVCVHSRLCLSCRLAPLLSCAPLVRAAGGAGALGWLARECGRCGGGVRPVEHLPALLGGAGAGAALCICSDLWVFWRTGAGAGALSCLLGWRARAIGSVQAGLHHHGCSGWTAALDGSHLAAHGHGWTHDGCHMPPAAPCHCVLLLLLLLSIYLCCVGLADGACCGLAR